MKHISLYETYTATANQSYLPVVTNVPNLKRDYETVASSYLKSLRKDYELGKGKQFDKKTGNCAWFTQDFFRWCEISRVPCKVIYFPETKKQEDAHVAAYMNGWVIDFAHKQFSKDKDETFKISKPEHYSKFGYDVSKADILDEFPNWIEQIYPPKSKK
jgi:hypothetical protein